MSTAWISIPTFAEPGQLHAFADREEPLASLYRPLVQAGNAVRAGQRNVAHRHVVYGYMGVGKSALILQTLKMLRESPADNTPGQRLLLPALGLDEPVDRQRWIILRVSGKHVASVDALADAIATKIQKEESEADSDPAQAPATEAMFPLFDMLASQADGALDTSLELPILSRLLRSDDQKLYRDVRVALRQLAEEVQKVQQWRGGKESRLRTASSVTEKSGQASLFGKAEGSAGPESRRVTGKAEAGASLKRETSFNEEQRLEGQWRVSAERLVDTLNGFFKATTRARIPTVLVLDDFDEVASSIGPSHHSRFQVLSWILGLFNRLCPTSLILSLRAEYMHEDVFRQFPLQTPVPPMDTAAARDAVAAWAEVHPGLSSQDKQSLLTAAERLLKCFPPRQQLLVPYRFLPVVQWLATRPSHPLVDDGELLKEYVRPRFMPHVVDALLRLSERMPEEDVLRCAAAHPVDPAPYDISDREREALSNAALLRPAMAGDPSERGIIIDPLCAYLRLMRA